MASTSHAELNSAISPDLRTRLDQLADLLLERYHIIVPPSPDRTPDAIARLAELGLPIPVDAVIDPDE